MELDKRNIPVLLNENKLDASLGKINISVKLIQLYETEDGYRHCLKEYFSANHHKGGLITNGL